MYQTPYIGITGFTDTYEVDRILPLFKESSHKLMVGVLVSSRTYRGVANKYPQRYPLPIGQLKDIFPNNPNVLNIVHYSTDCERPSEIVEELMGIHSRAGMRLHGFQLNIVWPDPKIISTFKAHFPDQKIVLQIGTRASEGHTPEMLGNHVTEYGDIIDYVLFDPSGGLGKMFQPSGVLPYLRALKQKNPTLGLGIAGGLSAETVYTQLHEIIQEFPDISIDAEGRLRDEHDMLVIEKAKKYVRKSQRLFMRSKMVH